jgi:glycosyltransferase involved in cell wall biosynthesis
MLRSPTQTEVELVGANSHRAGALRCRADDCRTVHIAAPPATVAYVVHAFAPGGLERCAAWLANGVDRNVYRPLVVSLTNCTVTGWLASDVPVVSLHKPPGNSLQTVACLARVLAEHHVQIVHSHSWPTLIECALARRWSRVPFHVHAEHGTLPNPVGLSRWRARVRATLMRWGLSSADRVIAVAQSIRAKVHYFCRFPPERVAIIPNGVEIPDPGAGPQLRPAIRASLGIPPQACVIGSVGRMASVKAFDLLLAAFEALAPQHPDLHLVVVGDGPDANRIARFAAQSGSPDRIHLVGHQPNPCDWLRMMDIYVNCSHSEGLSLAVLEAMGVGLPLVVTDVGDHGPLVSGDPPCGVKVRPGDLNDLVAAIDRLVTNDSLRLRMAHNASARQIRSHSIEAMIAAYESLYSSLHASSALGPLSRQGTIGC